MRYILEPATLGGKLSNKTDGYNCSGDYRDACTLVGQGLRHISRKSPRTRRFYHFKRQLENGCLSRYE